MGYALIVAALSLAGAVLPLRRRPGHAQLQIYLSLSAGALLGAALFHLLPEASEHIHHSFGLPAVIGIGVVFFLQRYVAPHSHEPGGGVSPEHHHESHTPHRELRREEAASGGDGRAAGRRPGSVIGVLALSIHSFFDGVAIGAVTDGASAGPSYVALAVFVSVLIHKPMDGLSVSVLLLNAGVQTRALWVTQVFYAALVPVGAVAFLLTRGAVADPSPLVGYTLAFSAGTFLAIALTDLLPELHFHAHDRNKLSAALLAGLAVMWVAGLVGHGPAGHEPAESAAHEADDADHASPVPADAVPRP